MPDFDVKSLTFTELQGEMNVLEQPQYRARQIYDWFHKRGAQSYDEMSNLPFELRNMLSNRFPIWGCDIEKKQVSQHDGTVKYLYRLNDGEFIESVLLRYKYGYTLCISTQAGCKMGCIFCATAIGGFIRNLAPSEMLSQIYTAKRDMNVRISHVVLMGMGEPLDNFMNVLRFLELVSNTDGLNIGMRNISLSTCGIVPEIYLLIEKKLQLTLSVSLHAPNDSIRSQIMPINKKYPVDELLEACRKYSKTTSRRISFEYALFDGFNDSDECAAQLAVKLKDMLCHVNLIPANQVTGICYKGSPPQKVEHFAELLKQNGINATIRRSLGSDIDASCGQLRTRRMR